MPGNKYKITQENMRQRDLNEMINFGRHTGYDLSHVYNGLNLPSSCEDYIGAAIGMMAFSDVVQFGVPMAVIAQHVGGLRNAALTELGMDVERWQFRGTPEETAQYREWISDGPEQVRRRKLQDILGIAERPSYQYLFLNRNQTVSVANNIDEKFGSKKCRFSIILDAFGYADEVRKCHPGTLFTIETEKGK